MEVKGKESSEKAFFISKNELELAQDKKQKYKLIFVQEVINDHLRKFFDLGNPFINFNEYEDFFHNTKYTVVFKEFEIRFG